MVGGVIFLSSCKKEYQCFCSYTETDGHVVATTYNLNTNNLPVAQAECKSYQSVVQNDYTYSCALVEGIK